MHDRERGREATDERTKPRCHNSWRFLRAAVDLLPAVSFVALAAAPSLSYAEPPAGRLLEPRDTAADSDPNIYEASLDTEVTYDDSVGQALDDGYNPRAFSQFEAAL